MTFVCSDAVKSYLPVVHRVVDEEVVHDHEQKLEISLGGAGAWDPEAKREWLSRLDLIERRAFESQLVANAKRQPE